MTKRLLHKADDYLQDRPHKRGKHLLAAHLSANFIGKLSDEILLNIFERLSLDQVLSCQSVSHRWQKISTDPELWKRLYFLRYIQPRFTHISTSNRTRIASRDWWIKETTHTEDGTKKDWKKLFKIRHNWHKGRCAVSEIDISPSSDHLETKIPPQASFWDELRVPMSSHLVQFDGRMFVAIDKTVGLRAWDIGVGCQKIVGCRRFRQYEQGWQLGDPAALTMASGGSTPPDIVVGFESGGVMILQLNIEDVGTQEDFGFTVRFILPPSIEPKKILHMAYSHPYLLTLDVDYSLQAYVFPSNSPHLDSPQCLATLQAHTLHGPCNLTLRRRKSDDDTITASIAYSMPLCHGGWSVGIQEIIFDMSSPNGISKTRIGTSHPSTINLRIHPDFETQGKSMSIPSASPTSISYSHPYLLTSHRDNTLTLYLCRSTDEKITIGQPKRLWGHTTGVAKAGVAGRGRAVSVSQVGGEVRVWELESVAASAAKMKAEGDGVVAIVESVRLENASARVGKELFLDDIPKIRNPICVDWIGFDEEKVLVVTRDQERDQNVTLYDFTY